MPQITFEYSLDCLRTLPEMFSDFPRNVWRHFPECSATFPRMFSDIPRNVLRHSPECLRTFSGMFGDIPRNVWGHSPDVWRHSLECLWTFPGMFGDIPRNITFPHSPRSVPRSCIPGFIHSHITVVCSTCKTWSITKETPAEHLPLQKQPFADVYKIGIFKNFLRLTRKHP